LIWIIFLRRLRKEKILILKGNRLWLAPIFTYKGRDVICTVKYGKIQIRIMRWTNKEIEILKKYYSTTPKNNLIEIFRKINRNRT